MNEADIYWIERLDDLRGLTPSGTDVEVGRLLMASPAMISHVRSGRRPLPFRLRLLVLQRLGYRVTNEVLIRCLSPEDHEAAIYALTAECSDALPEPPMPPVAPCVQSAKEGALKRLISGITPRNLHPEQ